MWLNKKFDKWWKNLYLNNFYQEKKTIFNFFFFSYFLLSQKSVLGCQEQKIA